MAEPSCRLWPGEQLRVGESTGHEAQGKQWVSSQADGPATSVTTVWRVSQETALDKTSRSVAGEGQHQRRNAGTKAAFLFYVRQKQAQE